MTFNSKHYTLLENMLVMDVTYTHAAEIEQITLKQKHCFEQHKRKF